MARLAQVNTVKHKTQRTAVQSVELFPCAATLQLLRCDERLLDFDNIQNCRRREPVSHFLHNFICLQVPVSLFKDNRRNISGECSASQWWQAEAGVFQTDVPPHALR